MTDTVSDANPQAEHKCRSIANSGKLRGVARRHWEDRYRYVIELGKELEVSNGIRQDLTEQGAGLRKSRLAFHPYRQ